MEGNEPTKGSFWTSLPGVLTAIAGIITGTAAILTALGTFTGDGGGDDPDPVPTSTSAQPLPTTPPPSPSPPPAPETAAIDVVYRGDPYGCTLFLEVDIAGVVATPQGLRHTIRDLPLGQQDYRITGQITCPTLGDCTASGEGQIVVQDGREYVLTWRATDVAECTVTLGQ